ncbi:MAG: amidohydrolase family protein [Patescibacteria group bacterium]
MRCRIDYGGEILLQTQQHGEAWYVDPVKCRAIYMKDGAVAYEAMRFLGLGILNRDIEKIEDGGTVAGTDPITPTPLGTSYPCDPAPLQRVFNDTPYYAGLMLDGHFHMPQLRVLTGEHASAPVLDVDVSKRDVACLFHSDRVTGAFAFYGIPSDLKDMGVNAARDIEQKYPGTIKHFLELVSFPGYPVVPSQIDAVLNADTGLFKGYGEFSLYLPHYSAVSPNDPAMREFYTIAEKHNLVVMMHPLQEQQLAVEQVLRDFPNVKFLFHAMERMSWANTFFDTDLDKYPNAYYSVDIDLFGQDATGKPFMESALDKQDFITRFKQRWQDTLNLEVATWKTRIERHPNQFLWGTDRGTAAWNYDPEVGSLLEEYSRAFIGRLDPAVQEKYAHKNAESLLQN